MIAKTMIIDIEVTSQIGKAANIFGKLRSCAWDNKYPTICTKAKIYETCVLPSLIYGSKTWAYHAITECKLNSFHICCLIKFLGITWRDKMPNMGHSYAMWYSGPASYPQMAQIRLAWPVVTYGH